MMPPSETPLTMAPPATAAEADGRQHPFFGLASFTEEDHALFFGRDAEAADLLARVRRETLTVLFGASGLGKSSLLQAGLAPRLRAGRCLPVSLRIDYGPEAPEPAGQIRARLRQEVARAGAELELAGGGADEAMTLWEFFHRAQFWSARNQLLTPVLILDQFEELFTLGGGRPGLEAFITELADLVENRIPASVRARLEATGEGLDFACDRQHFKVVLSLREDFLPQLEQLGGRIPGVRRNRMRLVRMNGVQALEAVCKPAPELVEETVGRRIVAFVAGAEDGATGEGAAGTGAPLARLDVEPAILSVVCRVLNEKRVEAGQARITAGLLTMSRRRILGDFYESAVAGLPSAGRVFIEERLLTRGGYRSSVAREDALEEGLRAEELALLVNRRLLRLEDRLGVAHVELTHDVLTGVIRESRDRRRAEAEKRRLEGARRSAERRFRLALGAAIATVLLALGVAWAAYDVFWREHVEYYVNAATLCGIPTGGQGPLTREEVRRRPSSVRLTRIGRDLRGRRFPYAKMEIIDGYEELYPDPSYTNLLNIQDENPANRACAWEVVTDDQGEPVYVKAFSRKRQMVYGFVFSPSTTVTLARGRYVGPDGYSLIGSGSAAEYVEFTLTRQGIPVRMRYLDGVGNPAPNPRSVFGFDRTYDEHGLLHESSALDERGQPMNDLTGVCTTRYEHNAQGLVTRSAVFDARERPCLNRNGYHALENRYDALGRLVETACFDTTGHAVRFGPDSGGNGSRKKAPPAPASLVRQYGDIAESDTAEEVNLSQGAWHREVLDYDAHGDLIRLRYYDEQGRPMLHAGAGVHEIRREFDGQGRETAERYLDTHGAPMRCALGFHAVRITCDERGNPERQDYLDEQDKPLRRPEGYASVRLRYDPDDNLAEKAYYDEHGQAVIAGPMQVHRIVRRYNRQGQLVQVSYWGPDGQKMACKGGYHLEVMTRDARGNLIQRRLFDAAGHPAAHAVAGWHSVRREFDDHGNVLKISYYDRQGQLALRRPEAYAAVTFEYDRWNHLAKLAFYDAGEKPLRPAGVGGQQAVYDYDRHGALTRWRLLDETGTLVSERENPGQGR